MKKALLLFLLSFINLYPQIQQDSINESTTFFNKKNLSLIAVSGVYIGTLVDSYVIWWKDDRRKFSFHSSSINPFEEEEKGIDKLGHLYTSYFFYHAQKNVFLWGGYSKETAELISGSMSLGMALIIEIGDGFSRFGFDYKDFLFNLTGLGYGYLQDRVPFFYNFNFKWSYIPPEGFSFPPRFSSHYDGHIYWLTINVHNLLGEPLNKYFPEFLQPAIGYSVGNKSTQREYIVGLDLNILSFFNEEDEVPYLIGKTLNLFHIPMPGIKYSEAFKPSYKLFLLN